MKNLLELSIRAYFNAFLYFSFTTLMVNRGLDLITMMLIIPIIFRYKKEKCKQKENLLLQFIMLNHITVFFFILLKRITEKQKNSIFSLFSYVSMYSDIVVVCRKLFSFFKWTEIMNFRTTICIEYHVRCNESFKSVTNWDNRIIITGILWKLFLLLLLFCVISPENG